MGSDGVWIAGIGAAAVLAAGAIAAAFLRPLLAKRPSADRNWSDEFAKTTTAVFHPDGRITLRNVRDWTYGPVLEKTWRDVTVDPSTITGVSFFLEPFAQWRAVGHAFPSFEFKDAGALSFSVEARRQVGQPYSAVRGAFRAYELAYQWGTERDFVTRRLLYLKHPLRLYPATIDAPTAQALFRDLAEEVNTLAEHPRFYNTLTLNCTNVLVYIINRHAPHTLPLDISWFLPGYSDEYLMRQGFIEIAGGSIEHTKALHDLTPHRAAVAAMATAPYAEFGARLRALLGSGR